MRAEPFSAFGARKWVPLFCSMLCAAILSTGEEPDSTAQNQISEEAILTGELEPLDTLYAVLDDHSRRDEWYAAIKQIAAHGRSDESSAVLLAFVKRGLPEGLGRIRTFQDCLLKMDVFMYLPLTGGDEARQAMRDAFLSEHDYLTAKWLPRVTEVDSTSRDCSWENSLRGRAALGLLISGNRRDERMVRRFFQDLHRSGPIYDECLGNLFSILLDSLVIADQVNAQGRTGVLFLYMSDVMDEDPFREKYRRDGHR